MRVVLDTNVLVSGTFWEGASFRVLQLADQGVLTWVVSKPILEEYLRVLHSGEIVAAGAAAPPSARRRSMR